VSVNEHHKFHNALIAHSKTNVQNDVQQRRLLQLYDLSPILGPFKLTVSGLDMHQRWLFLLVSNIDFLKSASRVEVRRRTGLGAREVV
jgi:hypothetical protein